MSLSKRNISFLIGIPLSILFLYLAVRQIEIHKTIEVIKGTNYLFLIPAAIVFVIDFSLRGLRWHYLLLPIKKCKLMNLMSTTFIGFFANNILPARAGELIRIVMIGSKENISKTSTTATIILERFMDVVAILILISITFFIYPYPSIVKNGIYALTAVMIFLTVLFYGLMFLRTPTLAFIKKLLSVFPKKIQQKSAILINLFIDGLEVLKDKKQMFIVLGISMLIWTIDSSVYLFIAKGMGITEIDYTGAIFIMTLTAIGISIPSSPGYLGVFEYFGILACTILGVEKSAALSFILVTHFVQFVMMTIAGMIFLARERVSLSQLGKEASQEAQ